MKNSYFFPVSIFYRQKAKNYYSFYCMKKVVKRKKWNAPTLTYFHISLWWIKVIPFKIMRAINFNWVYIRSMAYNSGINLNHIIVYLSGLVSDGKWIFKQKFQMFWKIWLENNNFKMLIISNGQNPSDISKKQFVKI